MRAPWTSTATLCGDRVEVEHGRPEGLLHVDHDQRGALAVEHAGGRH